MAAPPPRRLCTQRERPPVAYPASLGPGRASAIQVLKNWWLNGTVLHYYFMGGEEAQRDVVRRAWQEWKALGPHGIGLSFVEVNQADKAEIRISFDHSDGSWSLVGRDCLTAPHNEATMNFGWDLVSDPDTARHEIGHAIGFGHEHQSPFAGITWDEEAVYADLAREPNKWPRQQTWWNIIRKYSVTEVSGSHWDPNSIMHYPFGPHLIKEPAQYYKEGLRPAGGFSLTDIAEVTRLYPAINPAADLVLQPFNSVEVNITAGSQQNYRIEPQLSTYYVIQTLGSADTLIALFDATENADLPKYITADDDSGTDNNAKIRVKLSAGRRYVLRVRLYSKFKSGRFAVVMHYE